MKLKLNSGNKSINAKIERIRAGDQFLAVDEKGMREIEEISKKTPFKAPIAWASVRNMAILHVLALAGLKHALFDAHWGSLLTMFLYIVLSLLGIGVGAHRMWSHRALKARLPLRIFLMICQTIATQNDAIDWARDHRCHHKWTDTDADPHNTNRGFFFSHMGWLLVRKHPAMKESGAKLDLSDLFADGVLVFQRKYYRPLLLIFSLLVPVATAVYVFGEKPYYAFTVVFGLRCVIMLHFTWCINSVNHFFGYKPYDTTITPCESTITSVVTLGEGGHNFHHSFPQDYRTSEYPYLFNFSALFIDFCSRFGWVYDLKTADETSIVNIREKKGDSTVNRSSAKTWH